MTQYLVSERAFGLCHRFNDSEVMVTGDLEEFQAA